MACKCVALAALAATTARFAGASDDFASLPEVSYGALSTGCPRAAAAADEALRTVGGLTLTGVPDIAETEETLETWAACLDRTSPLRERALQRPLGDLHRVSVTSKMKLSQQLAPWPQCPGAEAGSVQMRLGVHRALQALLGALERAGDPKQASLLHGLVANATHLEHLHRYEELPSVQTGSFSDLLWSMLSFSDASSQTSLKALDLHTDAGLLLAFVPPTAASGPAEEALVSVELPGSGGARRLALPAKDSVVVFAGAASTLLGDALKWRPMPHALSLRAGFEWRAWYGVMLLLPEKTPVRSTSSSSSSTFGEYWTAAREYVIEQASPNGPPGEAPVLSCGDGRALVDAPQACGKGEMECWMTCMSVAGLDGCSGGEWERSSVENIASYSSLSVQCLDATSGKTWPSETGEMCPKCKPVCGFGDSAPSPGPSPSPSPLPTPPPASTDFCVPMSGEQGTTMYMDGFQWTAASKDATCLTFLFKSWILDTRWKFILACVGALLLGLSIEVINAARRHFAKKKNSTSARWMTYLLQAATLVLAYVIMLLIMTYSLELFIASIFGLALGPILGACLGRRGAGSEVQDPSLREGLTAEGDSAASATRPGCRNGSGGGDGGADHQGGAPCCRAAQGLDPQV